MLLLTERWAAKVASGLGIEMPDLCSHPRQGPASLFAWSKSSRVFRKKRVGNTQIIKVLLSLSLEL